MEKGRGCDRLLVASQTVMEDPKPEAAPHEA